MADTNITELRPGPVNYPTNALRQRRHRKRKAQSTVTARASRAQIEHVEKPNDIRPDVTVSAGRRNVADVAAYVAAIALAGAAAWLSVRPSRWFSGARRKYFWSLASTRCAAESGDPISYTLNR